MVVLTAARAQSQFSLADCLDQSFEASPVLLDASLRGCLFSGPLPFALPKLALVFAHQFHELINFRLLLHAASMRRISRRYQLAQLAYAGRGAISQPLTLP